MTTARGPQLAGQTVVLIGGSAGMGLETARRARAEGTMRPGGTLLFMGGTGGRRIGHGNGIASAATAALPP
ncbi:MAG: hypothetical protein WBH47_00110, partial [Streptosporangiaceae bacterium]